MADPPVAPEARVSYRRLLEETRDWSRAAEIQQSLVDEQGSGQDVLAHLLAEHARAVAKSDPPQARSLAAQAVVLAPDGAHGLLALARASLASGDRAGARAAAQEAVAREPETAAEGVALAVEAGESAADCARWLGELEEPLGDRSLPVSLARAEALERAGQQADAVQVVRAVVARTRARGGAPGAGSCSSPRGRWSRIAPSTAQSSVGSATRRWPSAAAVAAHASAPSTSAARDAERGTRCPASGAGPPGNLTPSEPGRNARSRLDA